MKATTGRLLRAIGLMVSITILVGCGSGKATGIPAAPIQEEAQTTVTTETPALIPTTEPTLGQGREAAAPSPTTGPTEAAPTPTQEMQTRTPMPAATRERIPQREPEPAQPQEPTPQPEPRPLPAAEPGTLEEISLLARASNEFNWALYHSLKKDGGNLWYSPVSVHAAMTLAYAGARGETAEQMRNALRYNLPPERLHPTAAALRETLAQKPGKYDHGALQLRVVNSVWGQKGHPFREEYLKTLSLYHGAGMRTTDFAGDQEGALKRINNWVSTETNDRIQELLSNEAVTETTKLVLANAVYFNATWEWYFSRSQTKAETFFNEDSTTTTVAMMYQDDEKYPYHEGKNYQAVKMYFDGNDASLIVLLPRDGLFEEVEETLYEQTVRAMTDRMRNQKVRLHMPRLEMTWQSDLIPALTRVGIKDAFSDTDADLSGMDGHSCTTSPRECLSISHVAHKSFVKIDEKGTEAAAASGVVIMPTGFQPNPPSPATMRVDRPFILMILDERTGAILFTGRVTQMTREMAGELPG